MILVTGVSGALGGLILDRLAAIPGLEVVAGTRAPDGIAARHPGLAPARRIDFDEPDTLNSGFTGVDVLVFISAGYGEDDVVLARHGAVIQAAARAGVRHVIYTSLAASGDQLTIALAHRWTEARLAAAAFDVTILRNGLYAEVPIGLALAATAHAAISTGIFAAPWGDGRVSSVAREDLADVAARVAVEAHADLSAVGSGRHVGRTYELAGVSTIGGAEVAATLTAELGTPIRYESASLGDARAALATAGLLPYQVMHTVSMFSNINAGLLEQRNTDLPALLDAAPRPVQDLIASMVRSAALVG